MIATWFFLSVAGLFALLFAIEIEPGDARPKLSQTGLVRWLVTGNWPAKVGAGLLLIGVGALLRYAMLKVELPPELKLGGGVLICALLAGGAFFLRERPDRHAIHIALAGASAGVAYLTAYSAYGFFDYGSETSALALLAMVAVATGTFAVTSRSMSIGILAMVGAYLAPAFALDNAGPGAVYGYYVAISALCLLMVALRGWRGLIHLSFLFTLAGAIFFYWTAKFAQPQYYGVMQPLLLALAAIHLAMPLVERRHLPSKWSSRFDTGYFVLLPVTAAVLTLLIAPGIQSQGSLGLAMLAAVWGGAALVLKLLKRDEMLRHLVVAIAFVFGAVLCRLDDVPWVLVGLGASVAALVAAPRLKWEQHTQEMLAGTVLLFGFLHVITALGADGAPLAPFSNPLFAKRLVGAALLGIAAYFARQRTLTMARTLQLVAAGWLLLAVADEFRRLYIEYVPQVAYFLLLGVLALSALAHRWLALRGLTVGIVALLLFGCSFWAADTGSSSFSVAALVLTPFVLLGVVFVRSRGKDSDGVATWLLTLLPFACLAFVTHAFDFGNADQAFPLLDTVVIGGIVSLAATKFWQPRSETLQQLLLPVLFVLVAFCLFGAAAMWVERSVAAVVFDLAGVAFLGLFAASRDVRGLRRPTGYGTTAVIAGGVVLQSMLLRLLGPPRVMTIADIASMAYPAVVSLTWAVFGAGLTWWGTRRASRGLWAMGAGLLVAAAVKVVLFDFGSLGDLANILAVIAAGLVFLGVAWLAPMPPKPAAPEPPPAPPPPPRGGPSPEPRSPLPPTPRVAATPPPLPAAPRVIEPKTTGRAVFDAPPPLPEPAATAPARETATAGEPAPEPDPGPAHPAVQARVASNYTAPAATISYAQPTSRLQQLLVLGALLVALALIVSMLGRMHRATERAKALEDQRIVAENYRRYDAQRAYEQEAAASRAAAEAAEAANAEATERANRQAQLQSSTRVIQGYPPTAPELPKLSPGQQGLDEALARGYVRRATNSPADEALWQTAGKYQDERTWEKLPRNPTNVYVVQRPFIIPDGGVPVWNAIFIVPVGVGRPRVGNVGAVIALYL